MSDQPTPTEPAPPAEPEPASPGDMLVADTPEPAAASDSPPPTEPVPAPEPPVTPVAEQLRQQVETANADLQPGQTVTTTVAGDTVVTGAPKTVVTKPTDVPEVEVDADGNPLTPPAQPGPVQVPADTDHNLSAHGDSAVIETPLGFVTVTYEQDAPASSEYVTIGVVSANQEFVQVSDAIVLRYRS